MIREKICCIPVSEYSGKIFSDKSKPFKFVSLVRSKVGKAERIRSLVAI